MDTNTRDDNSNTNYAIDTATIEEMINEINLDEISFLRLEIIENEDNLSEEKTSEEDKTDENSNEEKSLTSSSPNISEFKYIIRDIANHPEVLKLKNYEQHAHKSTYFHCTHVSFITYIICKKLNLDYVSATRAAMIHDLYYYDWHANEPGHRLHGFTHPKVALNNAQELFELNEKEKDIILKHMWPLTLSLPKYKESYVVTLVDKYCTSHEVISNIKVKIKSLFKK